MKIKIMCLAAALVFSCMIAEKYTDFSPKKLYNEVAEGAAELLNVNKDESLSHEKIGYGQGVQFNDKNQPLGALDFNEKYSKFNATAINDTKGKITLTFDQGYENGNTAKILDILKEKNVKATFFVLQDYAEKNPELIKRMIDEGHTVGNHSVTHKSMPTLTEEQCKSEIMDFHNYMLDKYNYKMTLFRPPMGEFSEFSLNLTKECGYKTELWSFAYADWDVNNQPDATASLEKLNNSLHDGAIYLLHSVSSTNTQILSDFIDNAKNAGYEFA
ncbi:MAG: polysaccharide deacetylase family protein [Oscillospiraceae bacterium]